MSRRCFPLLLIVVCGLVGSGCATARKSDTARTASEQILLSGAVDKAVQQVEFGDLNELAVFIDPQYLDSVDKGYVVSCLRHRVLQNGGLLAAGPDTADVVMEIRSGGVGTDSKESYLGTPSLGVPGMPISLPEIKLVSRSTQYGTAKLGLVVYDPKTRRGLGAGGETVARTNDDNWYVMGVGPFNRGDVANEILPPAAEEGEEEAESESWGAVIARRLRPPRLSQSRRPARVSLVDEDEQRLARQLRTGEFIVRPVGFQPPQD